MLGVPDAGRRRAGGLHSSMEARLTLAEFLLSSVDLGTSAIHGLHWLAEHAGVRQAVCFILDSSSRYLVAVADCGLTSRAGVDFTVEVDQRQHPLVRALAARGPLSLDGRGARAATPLDLACALVPLRGPQEESDLADGVLVVEAPGGRLSADTRWFARIFSQQVGRLRERQTLGEARAARERMLLYSTINAVTDPILLTDPEGKLIIANAGAEKLFTAPDDASEGWRQAVALNNMLFSAALSTSAMEAEEPTRRELLLVDSIEGTDLLFEHLSSTVKDSREGTFVVSVLRNVTDLGLAKAEIEGSQRKLRQAQADVREERRRLELIIDSVADPILVTDPAGDIVLMNAPAEKLFTAGADSDRAQRAVETNGALLSSFVSNVLFSGTDLPFRGELALVDQRDGQTIPVEAIAGQILSEQGELTRVVTILHDRTEALERARLYEQLRAASKELEAKVQGATAELAAQNELLRRQALELEQASALKTQFLANMSHEFRTPLNAILGYTQLLLHGVNGTLAHAQARHVRRIDSNAQHLLALINDILDISRIEAGRSVLRVTEFRLRSLIEEVVAELDPIIQRSGLALSWRLGRNVPALRTDRAKLKQILVNLLSNALKFTQYGSVDIAASAERGGREVAIAVSDTGPGIAPADRERVFEDFRQLDTSASRGYGGTGLGLSICRRLAQMLGGRIELDSRPGVGSTFTVRLPAVVRKRR